MCLRLGWRGERQQGQNSWLSAANRIKSVYLRNRVGWLGLGVVGERPRSGTLSSPPLASAAGSNTVLNLHHGRDRSLRPKPEA